MEEDTKPWWQSKTIWGSVVTAISLLMYLLGFGQMLDAGKIDTIVNLILLLFGSGGLLTSVVGRFIANKKIG
jgi:uncharacterized membrane protein